MKKFFLIAKEVLTHPVIFFEEAKRATLSDAVLYYFGLLLLVITVSVAIEFFVGISVFNFLEIIEELGSFTVLLIIAAPLIIVCAACIGVLLSFISAGFLHLFAKLFGGRGDYIDTYKIVAFSSTASIFSLIPLMGGLVSAAVGAVLVYYGLRVLHKLSTVRAILVIFMPLILISILVSLIVFMFLSSFLW